MKVQDSDVLPHPEPAFRGEIARTARDSKADQPVRGELVFSAAIGS